MEINDKTTQDTPEHYSCGKRVAIALFTATALTGILAGLVILEFLYSKAVG
jgi:hypothetical protein